MKTMKKLMAVALTLALVMSISISALAAGGLTVNNAINGQTYTAYKIFDLKQTNDGSGYSYQVQAGSLKDAVASSGVFDVSATADKDGNYSVTMASSATSAGVIEWLKENANLFTADGTSVVASGGTAAFTTLSDGYYYITTTTGTVVTIDSTNTSNVQIEDKNEVPSLDKDIVAVNSDSAGGYDNETSSAGTTASIGDTINYQVVITAQPGAENYIFHDKMSAGLTLSSGSISVKVGGGVLSAGNYQLTATPENAGSGNDTITIKFAKAYLDTITEATQIVITYDALLNENAVIASDGNPNTATLQYGHTPDSAGEPGNETPPDEPVVYTYEFQLVKDNSTKEILQGAEFELYADSAGTQRIIVKSDGDGYKVAEDQTGTSDTIVAGTPIIKGLGNGTYYLKETKAPEGYNKLDTMAVITINGANNDATVSGTTYTSGGLEVVNQSGTELPSTGGIGTKIFYAMGAVLVVGAGVMLVSKKRVGE